MTTASSTRRAELSREAKKRTAANGGIAPLPPEKHGKAWVANYWGCTCDKCVAARVAHLLRNRRERYAATARNGGIAPLPPEKHGRYSTVSHWGCWCVPCRTADAKYRNGST